MTTFTRKTGDSMRKFRSYSENFMLDVSALDGAQYPIALYHQEEGSAVSLTLHLTAAQAHALAHELLYAADVAEQATNTTPGD